MGIGGIEGACERCAKLETQIRALREELDSANRCHDQAEAEVWKYSEEAGALRAQVQQARAWARTWKRAAKRGREWTGILVRGAKEQKRIRELEAQVQRQAAVLRAIEWGADGIDLVPACPICYNTKKQGHAKDCTLAKTLKEMGECPNTRS